MTEVGVDWGGSNLRVFRYGPDGEVLETRASGDGAVMLERGAFEAALGALIDDWRPASGPALRIVMSGMVGAQGGWREAPYVPCPADLDAVASAKIRLETALGEAWIVPGVRLLLPGRPADVMRGEETQIFGTLGGESDALVVAPGTHSKWCRVRGGRIADFRTYLTGELFAVLRAHSVLGRTMQGQAHDAAGFARGMELAMSDPDLPGLLFSVRSEALCGRIAPEAGASYLSGLLIGAEVRAGLVWAGDVGQASILLIAAEGLAGSYKAALGAAGAGAVRCIDGAQASAQGLWRLARAGAPA